MGLNVLTEYAVHSFERRLPHRLDVVSMHSVRLIDKVHLVVHHTVYEGWLHLDVVKATVCAPAVCMDRRAGCHAFGDDSLQSFLVARLDELYVCVAGFATDQTEHPTLRTGIDPYGVSECELHFRRLLLCSRRRRAVEDFEACS